MKFSTSPADSEAMTIDDLAVFVEEMREYRKLPGDTVVRAFPVLEVNMAHGPRISRLTADTDG